MDKWNLFYTKADEKNIRTTSIWHFNKISQLLPTKSQQQVTKHRIRNHESMKTVKTLELECIISGGLCMCLTIWTKNHWTIYDRMTHDRPTDRSTNQPNKQINLINAKFIFATHCVYLTMLLNRVRALKMWNFTLM